MNLPSWFRSDLEKEVDEQRVRLNNIVNVKGDVNTLELNNLAKEVGASITDFSQGYGDASTPQIISNIHTALQTKAMIASVKTASNYVFVTILLALISLGSMVAAWIAVSK